MKYYQLILYLILLKYDLIYSAPTEAFSCTGLKQVILIMTNEIKNISLFEPEPIFVKSVQTCPSELTNCDCPLLLKSGLQSFLDWTTQALEIPSELISSDTEFSRDDLLIPENHHRIKRESNCTHNTTNFHPNDEIEDEMVDLIQMVENVRKNFLKSFMQSMGFLSEVDKTLNSDNDNNSNSNVNEWSVEQGNLGQFVTPIIKRLNSQSKINNRGWILVILNNERGNAQSNSSSEVVDAYPNLVSEMSNDTLLVLAETCSSCNRRGPFSLYGLGKCLDSLASSVTSLPQLPDAIRNLLKENLPPSQPVDLLQIQVEDDLLLGDWSPSSFQRNWLPRQLYRKSKNKD